MDSDPVVESKIRAQKTLDAEAGPDLVSYAANLRRHVEALEISHRVRIRYATITGGPIPFTSESGRYGAEVPSAGASVAETTAPYGDDSPEKDDPA